MGAFGFATGLASILRGQQQGQEASDAYRQQLQARQLEEQLKRMGLMAQLREGQEAESAIKGLPKEAQPYARLGQLGPYMQQQHAAKAGEMSSAAFRASALRESDPGKRAALNLAADMAKLGVGESTINEILRVGKVTGTGRANEFGQYQQAHPEMSIDDAIKGFNKLKSGSATEKFYAQPIGALKGYSVLQRNGEPFADPTMTVGDAIKAGGLVVTDQSAKALGNSLSAERNLDILDQAGKKVLPANVPVNRGEAAKDIFVNPAMRYFKAKVDPTYAGYEHAKAGLITYVRELAKAGRINESELNLIVDRLNNAQTYPALKSAVDTARQILRQDRQGLMKAGRLDVGASISGAAGGPPAAVGSAGTKPSRRAVYDTAGKIIGWTTNGKTMEPVR